MATVRFSDQLRGEIVSNAKKLIRSQQADTTEAPKHWGPMIYDGMFMDTINAMNAMPDNYFKTGSDIDISGIHWENGERIEQRMSLDIPSNSRFPAGVATDTHGLRGQWSSYRGGYLDGDDPRWATFITEFRIYTDVIAENIKARNKFVDGVEQVVKSYSTLAPALKAWPPLWDLLPEEKQSRHKEITQKRSKAEAPEIEGVDLDSLTGITVAAKLTRGAS
tara:strand:- start:1048 stop:1710 length:663 start_codon:yes stop_codon:yes gene_type:complete